MQSLLSAVAEGALGQSEVKGQTVAKGKVAGSQMKGHDTDRSNSSKGSKSQSYHGARGEVSSLCLLD